MKTFSIVVFVFLIGWSSQAQSGATGLSDEQQAKRAIEVFFEGFHAQDSTVIKTVVHDKVIMQSIGNNAQKDIVLSTQNFSQFLASICSIPEETEFKEEIHDYRVRVNGKMANVWTPYSFYVNGNLSHCGVNSFQLFKRDGVWKIFYIVDTRDRESCARNRG
ncbi:nuclear transport factor 2 family protein [Croceiramulus getboli]|nr:nuclear transport factor 2 family protein [Flavobacteriaceae bacterium YJPT1-3]